MILIDSSAGSKDLVRYAPLNDPSIACLTSLAVSSDSKSSVDVAFTGNGPEGKLSFAIEFKKLSDLLSSLNDNRLQATQIVSMLEEYDTCILLTCGEYRCGEDGYLEVPDSSAVLRCDRHNDNWHWYVKGVPYQGPFKSRSEAMSDYVNNSRAWQRYEWIGGKPMKYGYMESALMSLARAGVSHKHLPRIEDCAQWIGCLYRSWNKPWDGHRLFRSFDKSADRSPAMPQLDSVTKDIMTFAKGLPGMGFERALAVGRHFSSVWEASNADVSEWVKIDGIGKVIARSAVETIRRQKGANVKQASVSTVTKDDLNLDVFK